MNLSLNGKRALVCGASQGIGRAIAMRFAEMGASVTIIARSAEKLKNTLVELHQETGQVHSFITADFSNQETAFPKIKNIIDEGKEFDILVNNTGGPPPGQLQNASVDDMLLAFNMHVIMSQLLMQAVIPAMKKNGFGRLINVISIGVKQPVENLGVSNTIRGAMASWAKTLSRELAPYGITVNNLLPGQTKTSRLDNLIKNNAEKAGISFEEAAENMVSKIPAGRLGKPEELAAAAGFLASDKSGFINGINLPVDGGFLQCL